MDELSISIAIFWVKISLLTVCLKKYISIESWLHVLIKNENIINARSLAEVSHFSSHFQLPRRERSLLAGKVQKLILSEKNQRVLVLKIPFRKTEKKSRIRKNKLTPKFRATRYTYLACFGSTINNIGIINHLYSLRALSKSQNWQAGP